MFADDVKVYLKIVNVSDSVMLQGALDLIVEWASTWQLQLSVSKCNMLTIGYVPFYVKYSVYDRPTVLPYVTTSRDLGIIIAQDLSPGPKISQNVDYTQRGAMEAPSEARRREAPECRGG